MLRKLQIVAVPALVIALALVGCTPTPGPTPTPTPTESVETSATPSPTPTPAPESTAIPDCASIYSPTIVASLTSDGLVPLGDVSAPGMGGWGTTDPSIEAILATIPDRISCTWVLPASEAGATTSIARLDATTRTSLVAALAASGFSVTSIPEGELHTIVVETEVGSSNEAHLLTTEFWIGTSTTGGESAVLTLDAAAQLLP